MAKLASICGMLRRGVLAPQMQAVFEAGKKHVPPVSPLCPLWTDPLKKGGRKLALRAKIVLK